MNDFEVMFILPPFDEETVQNAEINVERFIVEHDGVIEKSDSWGKKRLAYKICDYDCGYYYLITFKMSDDNVKKLHEYMKSDSENVLRHMIIRKGE